MATAHHLTELAAAEAWRIECKFSRYREDSVLAEIHRSAGQPLIVDDETSDLLDFADRLFRLSEGAFDISSGVLRKLWTFDGRSSDPPPADLQQVLAHVGWNQARWKRPKLTLPRDMEIDFGGIGKEFAVDRASQQLRGASDAGCLVNFGGDLVISRPRKNLRPWQVGIESPDPGDRIAVQSIDLKLGGLATSGDLHRFAWIGGKRCGHILDPRTGYPVAGAPRSVTVAAGSCVDAGILATFAMLQGPNSEDFLEAQGVRHWVMR